MLFAVYVVGFFAGDDQSVVPFKIIVSKTLQSLFEPRLSKTNFF